MSIPIPRKYFTNDHIKSIMTDLVCVLENKEPVLLYLQTDDYIHIPIAYAQFLFNTQIDIFTLFIPTWYTVNISTTISLREYQIPIVNQCMDILLKHHSVLLGGYPGFGKTLCAIYMASKLNLLTLVMMHREGLLNQWRDSILNYTNSSVFIVGEGLHINPKSNNQYCDYILCMDGRYQQLDNDIINKIGFLVIDEAHLMMTSTRIPSILNNKPKYLLLCDATPERDDQLQKALYVLVHHEHFIMVKNPKVLKLFKYNTNFKAPFFTINYKGKTGIDWNKTTKFICEHEGRNNFIVHLALKYVGEKRKVLLMSTRVIHIKLLYNKIKQINNNIKVDYLASTKSEYKDSDILLGSVSKIGVGFDEQSACSDFNGIRIDVIILSTSFKGKAMTEQVVGRVLRSDHPTVIELVDEHPAIKSHYNKRLKVYKEKLGLVDENIVEITRE